MVVVVVEVVVVEVQILLSPLPAPLISDHSETVLSAGKVTKYASDEFQPRLYSTHDEYNIL